MKQILDKFSKKRIMVIGDMMLDKYTYGNVRRISAEAPIPIVEVQKEDYVPGGAGNSANNIASLDAKVYSVGVIGKDETGKQLKKEFRNKKINIDGLVEEKNRITTLKQRSVSQGQQMIRIDYEIREPIQKKTEQALINYIKNRISNIDGIIISDYAKGLITKNLVKKTIELANSYNVPIVIDTKPQHKMYYKNATIITPNEAEARTMAKLEKASIERVGKKLVKDLNTTVLITRGEKGMALFKKDGGIEYFPTVAREVYDVSGAGDTATAALILAIASKASIEEAVELANIAAGIVVGKRGTATITIKEMKNIINKK